LGVEGREERGGVGMKGEREREGGKEREREREGGNGRN